MATLQTLTASERQDHPQSGSQALSDRPAGFADVQGHVDRGFEWCVAAPGWSLGSRGPVGTALGVQATAARPLSAADVPESGTAACPANTRGSATACARATSHRHVHQTGTTPATWRAEDAGHADRGGIRTTETSHSQHLIRRARESRHHGPGTYPPTISI